MMMSVRKIILSCYRYLLVKLTPEQKRKAEELYGRELVIPGEVVAYYQSHRWKGRGRGWDFGGGLHPSLYTL